MEGQVRVTGLLGTDKLAGHLADPDRPQWDAAWGGMRSPRCDGASDEQSGLRAFLHRDVWGKDKIKQQNSGEAPR